MVKRRAGTIGSKLWTPDDLFTDTTLLITVRANLAANDLAQAIRTGFKIVPRDDYVYHASASVTLAQTQSAVAAGRAHGLHNWYALAESECNETSGEVPCPTVGEIAAYIALFDPSVSAAKILKGFKANAKKASIQSRVADYLTSKRELSPSVTVQRNKRAAVNVYLDFWSWSCLALEWAGPESNTVNVKMSHHVLPVFMHHFGCACPSYESLEIIRVLSQGRTVLDVGSGNGYWTYMLRSHGCKVIAVDNGQSEWRTLWIDDTVAVDGVRYIKTTRSGAKDDVLLMVYPVVGLEFTASVIDAYAGDTICIAGTQNGNGYTGFKDETVDQWMERERRDFEKIVQIPLPSFAGKDDALFVFRRRTTATTNTELT